jgi:hypothetical protein
MAVGPINVAVHEATLAGLPSKPTRVTVRMKATDG